MTLYFSRATSHKSGRSAISRSSEMWTLPDHAPSEDFHGRLRAGDTVATGRPRRVTVMVPPFWLI